jgi:hypothetical protein
MHTTFHPAPGLGDLPGGWFDVPSNPVQGPSSVLVPTQRAVYPNQVLQRGRLGDFVRASFPVPQNPLFMRNPLVMPNGGMGDFVPGQFPVPRNPLCQSQGGGMGCACDGASSAYYGMNGLGQTLSDVWSDATAGNWSQASSDFMSWLQEDSSVLPSIPNWGLVAGAVAAWMLFMPGGSEYRKKSSALRSQYRGYRRAGAAVASS